MSWYAWSGVREEPNLRSLYEWLDSQTRCTGGVAGGIFGTLMGFGIASFVLLVTILAKLSKGHPVSPASTWILCAFLAITLALGIAAIIHTRKTKKVKIRWSSTSRSYLYKLYSVRWTGGVENAIGQDTATALNAAAYDCLRCSTALRTPSWKSISSDPTWSATGERAEAAMESAMERLMMMFGQGATPEKPEVRRILDDMHETSEEVVKTAERLEIRVGAGGDVSRDLRSVLGEMRLLNAAHDEVMELDVRE